MSIFNSEIHYKIQKSWKNTGVLTRKTQCKVVIFGFHFLLKLNEIYDNIWSFFSHRKEKLSNHAGRLNVVIWRAVNRKSSILASLTIAIKWREKLLFLCTNSNTNSKKSSNLSTMVFRDQNNGCTIVFSIIMQEISTDTLRYPTQMQTIFIDWAFCKNIWVFNIRCVCFFCQTDRYESNL